MSKKSNIIKNTILACTVAGMVTIGGTAAEAALGDDLPLRAGDSHSDIKELQQELKSIGHYNGAVAGSYGSGTKRAVVKFQKSEGLTADGKFGPATYEALTGEAVSKSSNEDNTKTIKNAFKYKRALKSGINGSDVKGLQEALTQLGFYNGRIAGGYGSGTISAVKSFQKSRGLKVDGIFGPSAYKALTGQSANTSSSNKGSTTAKPNLTKKGLAASIVLRSGSTGEDVKQVQRALTDLGHYNGRIAGGYGSGTISAVRSFQKAKGLSADGIVGSSTVKAINDSLGLKAPSRNESRGIGLKIASEARKHLGTRYVFGGTSTSGFDCSGFTSYVYRQSGISIPRTTGSQASAGSKVSKSNLKVGDLVIFSNTYKRGPSHAGVYLGNGKFVHASSSGRGVTIDNINSSYYSGKFSYGRRVF